MQELIQNLPQTGHRIRSVEQGGQGNVDAALTYLVETDEKPVTFVYAAKDEERNSAVLLRDFIQETL